MPNRVSRLVHWLVNIASTLVAPVQAASDVFQQVVVVKMAATAATKGAMHALMMEVLAGHLTEHVVAGETEVERAREAQIIMDLLSKYAR